MFYTPSLHLKITTLTFHKIASQLNSYLALSGLPSCISISPIQVVSSETKIESSLQQSSASSSTPLPIIIGSVVGGLVGVSLIICLISAYKKRLHLKHGESSRVPNDLVEDLRVIDFTDISGLNDSNLVGFGSFKKIYQGKWRGADVALLQIKSKDLQNELR
jgi:hypothetical protein